MEILTQGSLATLLMEGLKWVIRYFMKNPVLDFSKIFYAVTLPVLNAVSAILLAFLQVSGYSFPTDWLSWGRTLIVSVLGALVSLLVYNQGLSPLKDYVASKKSKKQAKIPA